jgi:hypothetical protein
MRRTTLATGHFAPVDCLVEAKQPAAMCNLYRMKGRRQEVADFFRTQASPGANFDEEVSPGLSWAGYGGGIGANYDLELPASAEFDEARFQAEGREQCAQ